MTWQKEWIDYYELLEVSSTARTSVIEAAYKKLSLDYHPDRGGDTAMMQLLNDARETLLDELARKDYDREYAKRAGDGRSDGSAKGAGDGRSDGSAKGAGDGDGSASRAPGGDSYQSADGDARSTPQDRDRALQSLRRVATEDWTRASGARAERQREIDEQRRADENAAEESVAQQSTGLFGKLKRGVTCGIGAHKGRWHYLSADGCDQSRVCSRCGAAGENTTHEWRPAQRILDAECEFVTFCARCNDDLLSVDHRWQAQYVSTDCRQVDVCEHCSEVDHDSVRVRHDWDSWRADSDTARSRVCVRCGERETTVVPDRSVDVTQREPAMRSHGGLGLRRLGGSAGFTGRWRSPDGSIHDLRQVGNRVEIQGASLHGVLMQGVGTVDGQRATIDCLNNLGVSGRLVIDLTDDGGSINGIWHGMNGTSAVLMNRLG